MTQCRRCDRATPDELYLCAPCVEEWSIALVNAAEIAEDADTYRARVGSSWRFGQAGTSAETSLPYDTRVTPALDQLDSAIVGITTYTPTDALPVRVLAASRAVTGNAPSAPGRAVAAHAALANLIRLIDNPPDQAYFGRCGHDGCDHPLYFNTEDVTSVIVCPRCEQKYEVEDRRAFLLAATMNHLATVNEVRLLLTNLMGVQVSQQSLGRMVDKGLLVAHGKRATYDKLGRLRTAALYRIGDVIEIVRAKRSGHGVR